MNIAPILASSAVMQIHLAAAMLALASGSAIVLMRKGTVTHYRTGWLWVCAMTVVALSSFAIKAVVPGHFSPIHILSIITLIALPAGIWLRRQGNIRGHAITMISTFAGLLIAGAFTLVPGRLLHAVFFGP